MPEVAGRNFSASHWPPRMELLSETQEALLEYLKSHSTSSLNKAINKSYAGLLIDGKISGQRGR